jgi:hypothetical protein
MSASGFAITITFIMAGWAVGCFAIRFAIGALVTGRWRAVR